MSTFSSHAQWQRANPKRRRGALLFWAAVDFASIVFLYVSCFGGAA